MKIEFGIGIKDPDLYRISLRKSEPLVFLFDLGDTGSWGAHPPLGTPVDTAHLAPVLPGRVLPQPDAGRGAAGDL